MATPPTATGATDVGCADAINLAPDYDIDPARQTAGVFQAPSAPIDDQQQTGYWIQTIQSQQARNSADLWLMSRDYGGYGYVSVTATLNGQTLLGQVPQTGSSLTRIPIDSNNDYIADKWESDAGIAFVNPAQDAELNPYGASQGDGFSAFEEYRGFVVVSQPNQRPNQTPPCAPNCTTGTWIASHVRTNPVNKQDAFVVDMNSLFDNYGQILRNSTPFEYHSLSIDLANPVDQATSNPLLGVNPLRRSYSNHQSNVFAFAVVNATVQTQTGTALGASGGNLNNGAALRINVPEIQTAATSFSFDPGVLTAETLAHELGHKLGLAHYRDTRLAEPTLAGGTNAPTLIANPSLLPSNRYAPCYQPPCTSAIPVDRFDPTNQKIYVWTQVFQFNSQYQQNTIAQPQTGDLANIDVIPGMRVDAPQDFFLIAATPSTTDNIAQFTIFSGGSLPQPPSQIDLWIQRFEVMDWMPRRSSTMNSVGAWHFNSQLDLPFMSLCSDLIHGIPAPCPQ